MGQHLVRHVEETETTRKLQPWHKNHLMHACIIEHFEIRGFKSTQQLQVGPDYKCLNVALKYVNT